MRYGIWLTVVLLAGAATAQEPAAVATVRNAPGFRTAAEAMFRQYEGSLSTHCSDISIDWTRASHYVYGPIQTTPAGLIETATWAETVPGTACGQARRFRVLSVVREGKGGLDRMLPGESNTTALLEKDARVAIAGAIGAHAPHSFANCSMDVLDTEIVGHAVPKNGQPWDEVWLISECGHKMRVPIMFIPDGSGGTSFNLDPKKIVDVP